MKKLTKGFGLFYAAFLAMLVGLLTVPARATITADIADAAEDAITAAVTAIGPVLVAALAIAAGFLIYRLVRRAMR